ncbi:MAG TPA: YXWGXW repeat-containing protein [Kofleriaceae bacterium]|nr:YXWGXW repeat-containing protein [Kofleriaceae bacterium]
MRIFSKLILAGALLSGGVAAADNDWRTPDTTTQRDHRQGDQVARNDRDFDRAPPPKFEKHRERRGFVWVDGHWQKNRRRWVWIPGHFERRVASAGPGQHNRY